MGNRSSIAPALLGALLILALAVGCGSSGSGNETGAGTDKPNPVLRSAEFGVGPATIKAEIARSTLERERGLMFRTKLPDGTGMLFVFENDQRLAFWMKNTILPLSLAYISSDGVIRQIVDLEPQSLEAIQSERSVRYALEVPRGWFGRAGVKVGDLVHIPATE